MTADMSETAKPVYLVDAYSDPVVIRVEGRASFHNSSSLNDFFADCLSREKKNFVVDFRKCEGMDSTFLGVLAGVALKLRKTVPMPPMPPKHIALGSLVLTGMSARNLELARNLGLQHLATIDSGNYPMNFDAPGTALSQREMTNLDHAKLALEAHENLLAVDEANRSKFQDVVAFLRNRVDRQ